MERPEFEHFGIDKEQFDRSKSRDDKVRKIFCRVFILGGIIIGILIYIIRVLPFNQSVTVRDILGFIIMMGLWGLLGGLLGFIFGLPVAHISSEIYLSFFSTLSPLRRKVKNFEAARKKYDAWWIRTQKEFWTTLSGKRFEQEFAYLYSKLGYKIQLTPTTADKGIDIILKKDGKTIVVQCKAHKKPVSPHVVRDLYGTLVDSQADEAILASISGFTSGVKEFVVDKNIRLISIEDIIYIQKKLSLDKDNNG